jgi:hypothetical protein
MITPIKDITPPMSETSEGISLSHIQAIKMAKAGCK